MSIDLRSTNEKLAELLQEQTYDERMEMAAWFRDTFNDLKAGMTSDTGFDADDLAGLFSAWAEAELEPAEDASS